MRKHYLVDIDVIYTELDLTKMPEYGSLCGWL